MKFPIRAALALILMLAASAPAAVDLRDPFTRLIDEGIAAYREGDNARALAAFRDAAHLRPESFEATINRGLAHARLGEHDAAIQQFQKATDLAGDDARRRGWAHYNRGRAHFERVEQGAEALFTGMPDAPSPDKLLAEALESLDAFDQAVAADPDNDAAQHNRIQAQHVVRELAQLQQPPSEQQGEPDQSDEQSEQEQSESPPEGNEQQAGEDEQEQSDSRDAPGESEQPESSGQSDSRDDSGQNQPQDESGQSDTPESPEQQQEQESPASQSDAQPSDQMSEREARALLNLLGNEQLLQLRLPGMHLDPEKDW
ncbi:MAG: tetratricopeptide repeat protein [Candidatus Sumerlaeia bacterium]|nr:tetratricopeptide repeat protein [Candidatus Sumerlaeia bacterium]